MAKKRLGKNLDIYSEEGNYISADDIENVVVDVFGQAGAEYVKDLAETDDFDAFAAKMQLAGMQRCTELAGDGGKDLPSQSPIVNAVLVMRYPFLASSYMFDGNEEHSKFDWTQFDSISGGWARRFGLEMCEDIRDVLEVNGEENVENYFIEQIKEKYGTLRWYDGGVKGKDTFEDVQNVISLYEEFSAATCIECGSIENVYMSNGGWICPECLSCMRHQTREAGETEFAQSNGFTGRFLPFDVASKVRDYLLCSGYSWMNADIANVEHKVYSKDGDRTYNPYKLLKDKYPNLQLFKLEKDYAKAQLVEKVATLEEVQAMIAEAEAIKK